MYLQLQKSIFYIFGLAKSEILKSNEKNVRKILDNCHIGNILVEVVPEGCIYEIKLVALAMKHISSKYSPTNGIWALLLRGQCTVAMNICYGIFHFIKICYHIYTLSANLIPIPTIDVSK